MNKASKTLDYILRISSVFRIRIKTIKINTVLLFVVISSILLKFRTLTITFIIISRLESIQRNFLKYIQFHSKIDVHTYLTRRKEIHVFTLYERRKISGLAFLFSRVLV